MKSIAITAAIATLCVASTSATNPRRRRTTQTQHKSTGDARAVSDESYDPYLGMERKLDKEGSMSMPEGGSMSMSPTPSPVDPSTKAPTVSSA